MKAVPISVMHVASLLDENTVDEADYTFNLCAGGYIALAFDGKAPIGGNPGWRELYDAVLTRRPPMKEVRRTHIQSGKTVGPGSVRTHHNERRGGARPVWSGDRGG